MTRQSTTPVQYNMTQRDIPLNLMSSGRAGKIVPVSYAHLLRGDSYAGTVSVDIDLAEMPRPLLNGVTANYQAWFIPKSAMPQFSGMDEFMFAYQGGKIPNYVGGDRNPPYFFDTLTAGNGLDAFKNSDLAKTLGLHLGNKANADLVDAYNLLVNFRRAAHSSRIDKRPYFRESPLGSTSLSEAFWPSHNFSHVVPDYDRDIVTGALALDVTAGRIPISSPNYITASPGDPLPDGSGNQPNRASPASVSNQWKDGIVGGSLEFNDILAEMAGQSITTTLKDIDRARSTQAFAKMRQAFAGGDYSGYENDDAIIAELMQGYRVEGDALKRPWLLDEKRLAFGMKERHATDGASLRESVSRGISSASLSLNVPRTETGGIIMVTVEVVPERMYERQPDPFVSITDVDELPDALRDSLRIDPTDTVLNGHVDSRHANGGALYGYEGMNERFRRPRTALGGVFYQADPNTSVNAQRSAIWMVNTVNPQYTRDHHLVPTDFPHNVFLDTNGPAFEFVSRISGSIRGLTQFAESQLIENNDEFDAISDEFDDE